MSRREDVFDRLQVSARSDVILNKYMGLPNDIIPPGQSIIKEDAIGNYNTLVKLSDGYYEQVVDTATGKIILRKSENA